MAELKTIQVGEDPADRESYTVVPALPAEAEKPEADKKPPAASRKVR